VDRAAPAWSKFGQAAIPYTYEWPDDQIDLTVTTGRPRGAPGYRIHHAPTGLPVFVAGLPVCGGLETALQIARTTPLCYSVPLLDALCREDHRRLTDLAALIERRAGGRGIARARQAVSLANPLAESVLESLGRLLMLLGGLPVPTVQLAVTALGKRYRADLGYEEQRVLIEFDGREDHERWEDVASDMARQNALVNAGWTVLRFTWVQVLFKPEVVLRTIRDALTSGARV
jgi:very-short-patch-repair endonuclease